MGHRYRFPLRSPYLGAFSLVPLPSGIDVPQSTEGRRPIGNDRWKANSCREKSATRSVFIRARGQLAATWVVHARLAPDLSTDWQPWAGIGVTSIRRSIIVNWPDASSSQQCGQVTRRGEASALRLLSPVANGNPQADFRIQRSSHHLSIRYSSSSRAEFKKGPTGVLGASLTGASTYLVLYKNHWKLVVIRITLR